jgi:hypothetical protein
VVAVRFRFGAIAGWMDAIGVGVDAIDSRIGAIARRVRPGGQGYLLARSR